MCPSLCQSWVCFTAWALNAKPVFDIFLPIVIAAATVSLAIFTGKLFGATALVAKESLDALKWADRHHQERLSPVVVWDAKLNVKNVQDMAGNLTGLKRFHGDLTNVGGGPAFNILAVLDGQTYNLGALAAGQKDIGRTAEFSCSPFAVGTDLNYVAYTLTIQAQSQFGTWRSAVHARAEGQEAPIGTTVDDLEIIVRPVRPE